jgi:hypothetical protein
MTPNPLPPIPVLERVRAVFRHLAMNLPPCLPWTGMTPAIRGQFIYLLAQWKTVLRIIEQIRAGTYVQRKPRQTSEEPKAERQAAVRKPLPPGQLPKKFGWYARFVPESLRPFGCNFTHLVQQPEMAPLIAAAPEALGRPLRALCWAFGVKPPAIIAPPKRPRRPKPEKPAAEIPEPEPPLEWDWNGRLTPEQRANVPHADPLIYRMGLKGVRRPKGTRRGPPKMA